MSSGVLELLRTLVLNPCSLAAVLVVHLLTRWQHSTWLRLLNPLELSPTWWVAGYIAVRIALLGFVDSLCWVVGPKLPRLPTRDGQKVVYQHKINFLDVSYLFLNSIIEFVFAQQIAFLILESPLILRTTRDLGVFNAAVAIWLLLVLDDMLYAPMHRLMHHPALYRWVHKHHHRNTYPARGYVDAANEHPVEQVVALSLHWIAIHMVAHSVGLHVVALGAHFGIKALGACFNHTGFDLQFRMLGIDYSVRAHEMHHRKPNYNFAQYVMFWDQLMGTYQPYEHGRDGRLA
ncbi:hypothetical protein AB1Y20_003445 [Prymnesium parvum]|uniref:Fatty acid hydroxylase domain-containing protein n=1 Tax=Prymnesium parvum TaxID=97485 RepID=A0AB34JBY3_PRYPA